MNVSNIIRHPFTAVTAGILTVGQLSFGVVDPVISLLSSTSTFWFPAVATSGATILPEIGYPDLGTKLLMAGSILFVGINLNKLIDATQSWFKKRRND